MAVHVDEARRHDEVGHVQPMLRPEAGEVPERDDPIPHDPDVGLDRSVTQPVVQGAALQNVGVQRVRRPAHDFDALGPRGPAPGRNDDQGDE